MPAETPGVQASLAVGQLIGGRYRIVRPIGRGGMAQVFEALHEAIGLRVAVKVLLRSLSSNVNHVQRFVQEGRVIARIRHANVVDALDFGFLADGSAYMVMEFLEGLDLEGVLRMHGRLAWARTVSLARQVCGALSAAHQAGVIHRDLKPSNIFVNTKAGEECIKVIDFGVAKVLEGTADLTQTGAIVGSARYMAPEQVLGATFDARTDIYAFGALLFELVTGLTPFDSPNHYSVLYHQVNTAPRPCRDICPDSDVSDAGEALILRMLAKDPSKRPQTMQEVDELLAISVVDLPALAVDHRQNSSEQTELLPLCTPRSEQALDAWPTLKSTHSSAREVTAPTLVQLSSLYRKPPQPKVNLSVQFDSGELAQFPLRHGDYTVGRGDEADIQLDVHDVSRIHALISVRVNEIRVRDLQSKNGVFVRGARIQDATINVGDVMTIGRCRLSFCQI